MEPTVIFRDFEERDINIKSILKCDVLKLCQL